MEIIISKHAKERVEIYKLTEEMVKDALKNPDEIVEGYEGQKIAHKLLNDPILRVIYIKDNKNTKVITVYPAKKGRYWRQRK